MTDRTRYALLGATLIVIAGAIYSLNQLRPDRGNGEPVVTLSSETRTADFEKKARTFEPAKELVSPDGYINTNGEPIKLADYVGKKVIMLDFWTYSCINCERTSPYLTGWYKKYKDLGFEIIGVHTPEFAFEKDIKNVETAVKKFGITYPVVLDNQYATWDAYKNRFWPAHYLIDINGLIVEQHVGEGGYEETERTIQELLRERKTALGEGGDIPTDIFDVDQKINSGSPETYFGSGRNELLSNGKPGQSGNQKFELPTGRATNRLYLGGTWDMTTQYAQTVSPSARIAYKYDAKEVYFVASALNEGSRVSVFRDGVLVNEQRGSDVGPDGTLLIKEARLYKLISEQERGEHVIEIIISQPGLQAFTFTFG